MSRSFAGPHELGQNFLVDTRVVRDLVALVPRGAERVVELGAGAGAITAALVDAGHRVTAVELDPRRAAALRRRFGDRVDVVRGDLLRFEEPDGHDLVSNVPFGITTPLLRHLLGQRTWGTAVLLVQWEVARKRAALGSTTMLTASWWPWYTFGLAGRVPARAFRPMPSVDGGVLVIERRPEPLVPPGERAAYQAMVRRVFTGRGAGVGAILRGMLPGRVVARWLDAHRIAAGTLPGRLTAEQWAALHRAALHRTSS
ncbi:23S ribosomal RNA methyltransferase Erm [Cryptosporangium aurantiacum]|uniref:23S rRNA (Adenine-N6)-dimethyltransferase n=1 Tax=Cryptosporangium aurantiacum TaxID=134849 RepID=A0A1M7RI27_9ACTN|nr:23S ribosomal RNA methyltransferase Erm [Cryptosporangium aurantiacum]SHN45914.1 23S rRNA (adenine-N6)-dimethyltransferase [Cryptosporangium aurantiacum]